MVLICKFQYYSPVTKSIVNVQIRMVNATHPRDFIDNTQMVFAVRAPV